MICQGHWHGLLHLDPQVDVSTVWAVGPHTSRDEIRDLYHQVYKLQRLPGSLPCGPNQTCELARDVVSSLKNPPEAERGKPLWGQESQNLPTLSHHEARPHLCQEKPQWAEGGLLKGPSSYCHLRGEDWEVELVCHQRPTECPCPFPELRLLEEKVPGVEQEGLQDLTRGQPHPFPHA